MQQCLSQPISTGLISHPSLFASTNVTAGCACLAAAHIASVLKLLALMPRGKKPMNGADYSGTPLRDTVSGVATACCSDWHQTRAWKHNTGDVVDRIRHAGISE